uniref:Uncharacterized protein LOC108950386 n=1 Tax=Phallusia mammillata TaxID=59560 RepID=A0A6F9DK27_9ASCI|nr:uncharacterized protein LOC108950386 [Phallusia mammillata]
MTCATRRPPFQLACFICKTEALNYDNLLIISGTGSHWVLFVVDFKAKRLISINSLTSTTVENLVEGEIKIIQACYAVAQKEFNPEGWTVCECNDVPQQTNSTDCVVHVALNAFSIMNSIPIAKSVAYKKARNWLNSILTTDTTVERVMKTKSKDQLLCAVANVEKDWSCDCPIFPRSNKFFSGLFEIKDQPTLWDKCEDEHRQGGKV